jgi:hypothetical protein
LSACSVLKQKVKCDSQAVFVGYLAYCIEEVDRFYSENVRENHPPAISSGVDDVFTKIQENLDRYESLLKRGEALAKTMKRSRTYTCSHW